MLHYAAMLRNSKNSNSSRSFQSRALKNNRAIASNISVILNTDKFLRLFVQKIWSPQTNKQANILNN